MNYKLTLKYHDITMLLLIILLRNVCKEIQETKRLFLLSIFGNEQVLFFLLMSLYHEILTIARKSGAQQISPYLQKKVVSMIRKYQNHTLQTNHGTLMKSHQDTSRRQSKIGTLDSLLLLKCKKCIARVDAS